MIWWQASLLGFGIGIVLGIAVIMLVEFIKYKKFSKKNKMPAPKKKTKKKR